MHVAGDEDGTDGANVRRFLADVEVILISEPVLAGGVHAARNGRSAAGEEHHDVFAEIREVALVAGAKALAEADQQEERADSPGNAEHGEERTQLVRPEGAENLRENVEHHLHGVITREHRGGFWLFALSSQQPWSSLRIARGWSGVHLDVFGSPLNGYWRAVSSLALYCRWRRVHGIAADVASGGSASITVLTSPLGSRVSSRCGAFFCAWRRRKFQ